MTVVKPKQIQRFGPEWWCLYAAAWQALWPSSRKGVNVREGKDAGWKYVPADVPACVRAAVQDADEGMEAFNSAIEQIGSGT